MFEQSLFGPPDLGDGTCLAGFHPAVRAWFEERFPDGPTPPQLEGWRHIAGGADTLIAAPTGSGKTLAGFLVCIDRLYRAAGRGEAVDRPDPGRVRVAAQGPGRRHPAEPGGAAGRDRPGGSRPRVPAAPADRPGAQRRHHGVGARRDAAPPAQLPRHHARVAVPLRDRGAQPGDPGLGDHRDRRRDPRGGTRQAGLAPVADPGAAGAAVRTAPAAGRPVGHPAPDRDRRPPARRRRPRAQRPRRAAGRRDRRRRPPAPHGPRHRAARRRARSRRLGRAARRGARPHRRPRDGPSHHARVRQHPAHGRARRPPARRAARRRRGRGPPRQPVEGPAAAGRDPAAGRRAAGPGRHRVARARDRHRPGRAGLPDRVAPQPGHLPPAGGPVRPQSGWRHRRAACSR